MEKRNLAVLVGNGLSIAFNPNLTLASITERLLEQLRDESANGDKIVHAMNEIARREVSRGEVTDEDFEKLVGAFDSQALTLEELAKLAQLVEEDDKALSDAISQVSTFSQRVRDRGISYVLQTIMERSYGHHDEHAGIHEVLEEISDSFDGRIHYGNLNYDTLLMSALKANSTPMCDMASGYKTSPMRVVADENEDGSRETIDTYIAHKLRTSLDFPQGPHHRVRLIHLHGSLVFWYNTVDLQHIKIPVDVLRVHSLWEGLRDGEPAFRPSVVLANERDKGHHVKKFPFSLSYEAFAEGLSESEHWMIVGYSFRDSCVNDLLRAEFLSRSKKPQVLVSTYGNDLTLEEIELALGWGAEDGDSSIWLTVDRAGFEDLPGSLGWEVFSAVPSLTMN